MELKQRQRASTKHSLREQIRNRGYSYVDDNTDIDEIELTPEDYDDAPYEADDLSDYEESEERQDDIHVAKRSGVQPIWLLYEGQILWATSNFGTRLAEKEYLRRRLQLLLNFLKGQFPDKSYDELLLSLQGFFVRDNDNEEDSAYWLESLKNVGIIYCEGHILALKNFRAGKGESKSRGLVRLPKYLEYLWLERELMKPENISDKPFSWTNCQHWLLDGLKSFCKEINEFCATLDNLKHDKNTHGLALKQVKFGYMKSTLQRKRLKEWAQWWDKKERK